MREFSLYRILGKSRPTEQVSNFTLTPPDESSQPKSLPVGSSITLYESETASLTFVVKKPDAADLVHSRKDHTANIFWGSMKGRTRFTLSEYGWHDSRKREIQPGIHVNDSASKIEGPHGKILFDDTRAVKIEKPPNRLFTSSDSRHRILVKAI